MIVVKVELWPKGSRENKRFLGQARIINDGTGTVDSGNYTIELTYAGKRGTFSTGTLSGFPRRKLNAWHLLMCSLVATIGETLREVFPEKEDHE